MEGISSVSSPFLPGHVSPFDFPFPVRQSFSSCHKSVQACKLYRCYLPIRNGFAINLQNITLNSTFTRLPLPHKHGTTCKPSRNLAEGQSLGKVRTPSSGNPRRTPNERSATVHRESWSLDGPPRHGGLTVLPTGDPIHTHI